MANFEVILLAAGIGSRLKPISDHVPKCLVPICGRPLLGIWLDQLLNENEVTKIHINTCYKAEQVEEFVRSYNSEKIEIHRENDLLGTAGTINKLINYIHAKSVLIIHADNLSLFDLKKFKCTFDKRKNGLIGTMMTFKTQNPETCGMIEVDNNNQIVKFIEKPLKTRLKIANAAIYFLDVSSYILYKNNTHFDFSKDFVSKHFQLFNIYENSILHTDIGTVESFIDCQFEYYNKIVKNRII